MSDEQLNKDITNYTNWLSQFEDCPHCDGIGYFNESDCCNAPIRYEDTICEKCGEHCDNSRCEECQGTGTIEKQDNWWDE